MQHSAKLFVAGHKGLIGSAIVRQLQHCGYDNLLLRSHRDLDLCDQRAVAQFFLAEKPEYVFLAAARVGGILANATYRADFIRDNLNIQLNVIDQAFRTGVRRLLFLGSSCIYPRMAPQPIKESYLLTGPLETTNRPYAIAKIAGVEMCSAYNLQHGCHFLAAMPTNAYGPNDNYHLDNSHVLPALLRKMHEAKCSQLPEVMLWGTGTPRREFIYSDDVGEACLFLMNLPEADFDKLTRTETELPIVNVGCGQDLTIHDLAEMIATVVGFTGNICWDSSRPDGTPKKLMDSTKLNALGWRARTPLLVGLQRTYDDFCRNEAKRAAKATCVVPARRGGS